MKINSAERIGTDEAWNVSFSNDDGECVRRVRLSDDALKAYKRKDVIAYTLYKAVRDAQREIAILKYGEDEWGFHVGKFPDLDGESIKIFYDAT